MDDDAAQIVSIIPQLLAFANTLARAALELT